MTEGKVAETDGRSGVAGGKGGEVGQGTDGKRGTVIEKVGAGIAASLGQFGDNKSMPPGPDDEEGHWESGRFGWKIGNRHGERHYMENIAEDGLGARGKGIMQKVHGNNGQRGAARWPPGRTRMGERKRFCALGGKVL